MFVTVGLEKFPFDRLFRAIDGAIEAGVVHGPVFAQTGHSGYRPRRFDHTPFLSFDETRRRVQDADLVVCHAGVGTILLATGLGQTPIVFPRRAAFGEHVDDHQVDLAVRLQATGRLPVAFEEADLIALLRAAGEQAGETRRPSAGSGELARLIAFLRDTLEVPDAS